jgi:U2-associated protein SR140
MGVKGYNSVFSTDSAEESERERTRKTKLGKLARKRFEGMLRSLSGSRGELARCMAFSLEHAEASNEVFILTWMFCAFINRSHTQVADIIIASLVVDGTPVPRKLARLHLICDILHNSAAPLPMAWKFRQEFQSRLGLVFDHFSTIYHSFPGRITAETFKGQITGVLDIWEDWIVFPPDFTLHLRRRIEGQVQEEALEVEEAPVEVEEPTPAPVSRFKTSSFKPAELAELPKTTAVQDDGGETPMDTESDVDGEPLGDIDGEPLENIDGEPMDDIDGAPLDDDIDGAPLEDDVDGAPLDEDIDGAPMGDVDDEPTV